MLGTISPKEAMHLLSRALKTGVEGVYDRHSYDHEKADALKRLASLIDRREIAAACGMLTADTSG